jgi:hypothetical protein
VWKVERKGMLAGNHEDWAWTCIYMTLDLQPYQYPEDKEMAFKTFFFGHLTWLIAQEDFIILNHQKSTRSYIINPYREELYHDI